MPAVSWAQRRVPIREVPHLWLRGSLGDAAVGGVADQFVAAREVQFGEDVADVVLGGAGRDMQLGADLLVAVAAGHLAQHLAFAPRQRLAARNAGGEAAELA